MKPTPNKRPRRDLDKPRSEYEFDYRTSRTNRFAGRAGATKVTVVLEPDVAQVFDTSKAVNQLLRSVIKALPGATASSRRARKTG